MISKEEIFKIINEELESWWQRVKDYNIPRWRLGTYKTLSLIKERIEKYETKNPQK